MSNNSSKRRLRCFNRLLRFIKNLFNKPISLIILGILIIFIALVTQLLSGQLYIFLDYIASYFSRYFYYEYVEKLTGAIISLFIFIGGILLTTGITLLLIKTISRLQESDIKQIKLEKTLIENFNKNVIRKQDKLLVGGTESKIIDNSVTPEERQSLLLNEYYQQGLQQSSISFNFSIWAAVSGFSIIILSVLKPIFSELSDQSNIQTVIQIGAGTIINAVSSIFFVLSNRNKKAMIEFSEKLRIDRKLNEALDLLESIEDDYSIKTKIKALVIIEFSGLSISKEELFSILMNEKVSLKKNKERVESEISKRDCELS